MNLILSEKNNFDGEILNLSGRQLEHIRDVLRAEVGDVLKVGEVNGKVGQGEVLGLDEKNVQLKVHLDSLPPKKLPVILVVALPRPKSLPRILQTVTSLGVEEVVFVNSYRVEKFFWSSDYLSEESVYKNCILGLEQAVDTVLPKISWQRRFRPFVEDVLPEMLKGREGIVAHPYSESPCPKDIEGPVLLALGPEGGWIDFEVDLLEKAGLRSVNFSSRILRLETAVTALISRVCSL